MATVGNESRPAYVYDLETDTWVPIGIGPHTHDEYIDKTIITAKGDIVIGVDLDTPGILDVGEDNQVLTANSSATNGVEWATQEGYRLVETIYYTSSGTFTKATYPWLNAIRVRCQGGGGAGGGIPSSTTNVARTGGGGGGYAESFITDIEGLAASVTVTCGAGGSGVSNADGNSGGSSSFGTLVVATGGAGGSSNPFYNGGEGTAGNLLIDGSSGGPFYADGTTAFAGAFGGMGGGSQLGASTFARYPTSGSTISQDGRLYGGGGSGAVGRGTSSAAAGGAGAAGIVIVDLFG